MKKLLRLRRLCSLREDEISLEEEIERNRLVTFFWTRALKDCYVIGLNICILPTLSNTGFRAAALPSHCMPEYISCCLCKACGNITSVSRFHPLWQCDAFLPDSFSYKTFESKWLRRREALLKEMHTGDNLFRYYKERPYNSTEEWLSAYQPKIKN